MTPETTDRSFGEVARDCAALAGLPEPANAPLADVLAAAIWHDQLGALVAAFAAGPPGDLAEADLALMARARDALAAVNARVEAACRDIRAALSAAGVDTRPSGAAPGHRQFDAFDLDIARADLAPALAELGQRGFSPARALSPGAVAALAATRDRLDLARDSDEMRLVLHWPPGPAARLPRRLRPDFPDFALAALPAPLWPLYAALHPVRARLEALTGRPLRPGAALVHSTVSLGTPPGLIAPLLEAADVAPGDRLLDIGCGDGRVVLAAARTFGCAALGIEANPVLAARGRARLETGPARGKARIETRLATPDDARDATVVFLFQPMHLAVTLAPAILDALPPGGRLVLHEQTAPDPRLAPDRSLPLFSDDGMTVAHLWRK